MVIIATTLAFLIGSIPFAIIFTRYTGTDVRKIGSGNPGFMNAMRAIGIKRALPVLIGDIGKGWLGAYLALVLGGGWWADIFVVVGHCFSPWLKFRGGKGVATFIGVALAANPLLAILAIAAWILILIL